MSKILLCCNLLVLHLFVCFTFVLSSILRVIVANHVFLTFVSLLPIMLISLFCSSLSVIFDNCGARFCHFCDSGFVLSSLIKISCCRVLLSFFVACGVDLFLLYLAPSVFIIWFAIIIIGLFSRGCKFLGVCWCVLV